MKEIYAEYSNFNYFLSGYTTIFENVASFEATKISNDSQDTIVAELNEDSMRLIFEPGRSFYVFDIPGGIANVQSIANAIFALMQANQSPKDVNITNTALPIDDSPPINVTVSNPFSGNVLLDPSTYDAFGRLRTSEPKTVFETNFFYDSQPTVMQSLVTGAATVAHNTTNKMMVMTATAAGNKAVFQSKQYHTYQAGKSLLVMMTGLLTTSMSHTGMSRLGYFDDNADKTVGLAGGNGFFYQFNNGVVSLVARSYVTGGQLDAGVLQSSWNGDKLDGTGSSGMTADWTKTQIFWMDIEWLGVGSVRCGVVHEGKFIVCHIFHHNNLISVPYMQTACLPVRWEAKTTAGQTAECKAVCCTVISEGGFSFRGKFRVWDHSVANIPTAVTLSSGSFQPIISIRSKSTHNRVTINPLSVSAFINANKSVALRFIVNGVTGGTFTSLGTDSAVEYCNDTTGGLALSGGGTQYRSMFISSSAAMLLSDFEDVVKLWADIAGTSDILTVAGMNLSAGTASTFIALSWQEWF